jgi:hypothetical protein
MGRRLNAEYALEQNHKRRLKFTVTRSARLLSEKEAGDVAKLVARLVVSFLADQPGEARKAFGTDLVRRPAGSAA